MGRVLRIGAMIMGVLLVVMTAGLSIQRNLGKLPPSIIITQRRGNSCSGCSGSNTVWLSQMVLGQTRPRRLTPDFEPTGHIVDSPNGEWFYFDTTAQDGTRTLSRMRLDGSQLGKLVENGNIRQFFQMDGEWWLLYQRSVLPDNLQVYVSRLDSSSQSVLAGGFEGKISGYLKVSPESQSLIFVGEIDGISDVYRVSLMGGPIENLTEEIGQPIESFSYFSGSEWLVLDSNLILNLTDGRIQPLSTNITSIAGYLHLWVEESGLLLLYDSLDSIVYGVHLGQPEPVWVRENEIIFNAVSTPDSDWLILQSKNRIERMRVDGTESNVLYGDNHKPISIWEVTPDGQWVLFEERNVNQSFLKRLRIRDSKVETLYELGSDYYQFDSWSPDQRWGIFRSWNHENPISRIFLMRSDGTDIQFLTQHSILAWGGDVNRTWQPVFPWFMGAGLVIMGIANKPLRRIRKRLRLTA